MQTRSLTRPCEYNILSIFGSALLIATTGALAGCADVPDDASTKLASSDQPLSGQTNPSPDQILVCPDADFAGNCQLMGLGLYPNSAGVPNDSMSSIKVGSNVRVSLCRDSAFRGTCQTIDAGRQLGRLGYESIGNDTVSSVRVVPASTPDCRGRTFDSPPPSGWVFLYRDANWQNDCVAVSYGSYWNVLDAGMAGDSLSSALIPADLHTGLIMYEHQGYQGQSYAPWSPGWDTKYARPWSANFSWFNDMASSLVVVGW